MRKIGFTLIILALVFSCKDNKQTEILVNEPSQIFFNGDILTMSSETPEYAEAIVEQHGKIVCGGSLADAEVKYLDAKKIDLNGKTLVPGFIDPHSHFGMVSNTMGQVDLNPEPVGSVTNIEDILSNLK